MVVLFSVGNGTMIHTDQHALCRRCGGVKMILKNIGGETVCVVCAKIIERELEARK